MNEILNNINNAEFNKREKIIKNIFSAWFNSNTLKMSNDDNITEISNLILFKFRDKFNISVENIVGSVILKYIEKNFKNMTALKIYLGPYYILRTGCNDIEISIRIIDVYDSNTKNKSTTKLILDTFVKEYNLTKTGVKLGEFKYMLIKKGKYYKISSYKEERKINE